MQYIAEVKQTTLHKITKLHRILWCVETHNLVISPKLWGNCGLVKSGEIIEFVSWYKQTN